MNLVTDPWIPVILQDGACKTISLMEAFTNGTEVRDLALNPVQRVSVMRLLICVAQAALDGPDDEDDWLTCRDRIPGAAKDYLEKWRDHFDLYGERAFLQVPKLRVKEGKEFTTRLDKLDIALAVGNAHTLFDWAATPYPSRNHAINDLPLMLLISQCFSLGGGNSPAASWGTDVVDGKVNTKGKGKKINNNFTAGCLSGSKMIAFLRGSSLSRTIHLNIISKRTVRRAMPGSEFGQPIWQAFPRTYDGKHIRNIRHDYLTRLVPISRFISLDPNNTGYFRAYTNGYAYPDSPNEYREPMCSLILINDEPSCLKLDHAKHPWRELSAIFALENEQSGPLAFAHLRTLQACASDDAVDVWIGGLLSSKGKPILPMEWSFVACAEMQGDDWKQAYTSGLHLAERGEGMVRNSIGEYLARMAVAAFEKTESGAFKKNDKPARDERKKKLQPGLARFWTHMDAESGVLLRAAADLQAHLNDTWYPVVRAAMQDAYERTCPHTTPRQIQAYAQGLTKLEDNRELDE